jgi:hypothetical protein
VTSTRPPSNGPVTRARSRTAAAHCEQPAPPKSSRNAATLAATAAACAACDPQLVRTPTNCDQLNYLDRELYRGHYCTLSTGSPLRGSTSTLHSRRPVVSYRTKQPDTSGPNTPPKPPFLGYNVPALSQKQPPSPVLQTFETPMFMSSSIKFIIHKLNVEGTHSFALLMCLLKICIDAYM